MIDKNTLAANDRLLLHLLTALGTDYETTLATAPAQDLEPALGNRLVMSYQRSYLTHLEQLDGQDHHTEGWRYARTVTRAAQMVMVVLASLGADQLTPNPMLAEAAIAATAELLVTHGNQDGSAMFTQAAASAELVHRLENVSLPPLTRPEN